MVGIVSTAMGEQASALGQIATGAETVRVQSDQTVRAIKQQTRAVKDVADAAENTAKQIKLITIANREHSVVAGQLLDTLKQIREITDRNAHGVQETRGGTNDLVERAAALVSLAERSTGRHPRGYGANRSGR
jgi:methyl-accepting chemotaxis protein